MLVTNQLSMSPTGGRELLCKVNYDALKEICGDQLILVELARKRIRNVIEIANAFRGHIDGLNAELISSALQILVDQNITKVFIDGSNLGEFAKIVKKRLPQVQVITFYHNVEARFFLGAFKQFKTLQALVVLVVNFLAERKSVRYSDKLICLCSRDSRLLHKLYGREATHLSAIALADTLRPGHTGRSATESYLLFVGNVFYANRAGITWFVRHVVPRIRFKTYIVGRGFEDLKAELEREGNVEVIGTVDDLTQWYLNAYLVIAPIFDGSGMKTKIAEALMHGKRVVGTPEAFTGYEDIADQAGWVCTTVDDFVTALERANELVLDRFDEKLRSLYVKHYSLAAKRSCLAGILESSPIWPKEEKACLGRVDR